MTLYKNIFTKSWSITRQHPVLWLFGAFMLFWGGKSIELEQFFTNANLLQSPVSIFRPSFWEWNQLVVVQDLFAGNPWTLVAIVALAIVAGVFAFVLIMSAHITLADAYGQFEQGKGERYTLRHAYGALKKDFVAVSVVQVVTKGIGYALLCVTALPLFFETLGDARFAYTLVLYFVTTPIAVVLSVVGKFATVAIVTDKLGVMRSLFIGWTLFVKNYGVVIEYMVFTYVVYTLVTTLAVAATLLVSMPLLYIGYGQWATQEVFTGITLYKWVSEIIGLVVVFSAASIFSAWHMGGWTLLYAEVRGGAHTAYAGRVWRKEK